MPFRNQVTKAMLVVSAAGLAQMSCRPASYELIRFSKPKKLAPQGDPSQVAPPDSRTVQPLPPPPIDGNVPPTARVEVIWKGESVVKVRVGEPVEVRPTWDTLDPDDIGRSACANPGIVRADYDIATEAKPSAQRTAGCESLAVPQTFATPGDYEITMTVTSNENETAVAKMILTVIAADAPITGPGSPDAGFTIKADPMLAATGQVVTFTGRCITTKKYAISWTFADGASADGRIVTHAYPKTGQFPVKAICTEEGGRKLDAQVTIVVIDKQVEIPGRPTRPGTGDGDDTGDDGTPGDDNGGDDNGGDDTDDGGNPGQGNPGQGSKPGQQDPIVLQPQPVIPVGAAYPYNPYDPGTIDGYWF